VVRLVDNHKDPTCSKVGESWKSSHCGRPLGMKFNSKGILYVTEPSYGIFTVDLSSPTTKSPTVRKVLPIEKTAELGAQSKFFDDLGVHEGGGAKGGDVLYVSDVSTKFDLEHFFHCISASEQGRLVKYDIDSDKIESVANSLYGVNGVEVNDDKTAVIFAEMIPRRLLKYHISGAKKGQVEVFTDNLPGEPDNVRRSASKQETYWVALVGARNASNANSIDLLAKRPIVRKFISRFMYLVGSAIEKAGELAGYIPLAEFGFKIRTMIIALPPFPHGIAVEVDKNGKVINSLHSPDGVLTFVSEVREVRLNEKETVLYLGTWTHSYLGKLILKR